MTTSGTPAQSADLSVDEQPTGNPPTVMIAVEDSEESVAAVRRAHHLFGDRARYFVVNVGYSRTSSMQWASAYPVMLPAVWYPPASADDDDGLTDDERAQRRAADIAESSDIDDITPIGDVGDPATAIIEAAHEHAVDVVVIASHDRSWFSRLLAGSVEHDLLREADFAVLVLK